jgi:hypothetical protein
MRAEVGAYSDQLQNEMAAQQAAKTPKYANSKVLIRPSN